ncbi:MAG: cellulase family glycosylhydrolase [Ardenticatenales bacterium]|nr:cellulase family glycosylhydrolase [Ardenticatenales bacterium]
MKHPRLIFLGILLLLILYPGSLNPYDFTGEESVAAQARGMVQWLNSALRPQPDLAPTAELTFAAPSPFGVNTFLEQEVLPDVRAQSLRLIHEAGFQFIRQEFPWEDIEIHGKGDFLDRRNLEAVGEVNAWAKYDHIVDLARQNDVEIIARLSNPPAWSRAAGDEAGAHAPPDNYDDFGDFVAAVVSRYQGRITYFQLWNEPNIYPEWGTQIPDPVAFTDLLCTGYRRAKAANPQAILLAPALSPTIAYDARDRNDLIFLQRMYLAGAGACFDIMSAQGYGLFSGPTDRRLRPTVINFPHHLFLRDLMVRFGDAGKPLWISEVGWNTVPEGLPRPYGQVTPAQQAAYTVQAFQRAQAEWPWVGEMNVWFFKRPTDQERGEAWYYFRLLEPDFEEMPAFTALSTYMNNPTTHQITPRSPFWYTWNRIRPTLAAIVGGLFFFLLLRALEVGGMRGER